MTFGIQSYASFLGAIVLFQIIPGPGTLAILGATARGGKSAGICAVLGTLSGDLLFMLCAVLGLASVLSARPVVLASLQWIGIVYLCWLGLQLLRAPRAEDGVGLAVVPTKRVYFRNAFFVGLTNPKAIMFFMAFFPLFLSPESKVWTLIVMMAHVSLISFAYQFALVIVGNVCAVRLSGFQWVPIATRRVAGLALIGFGIKLAIAKK